MAELSGMDPFNGGASGKTDARSAGEPEAESYERE